MSNCDCGFNHQMGAIEEWTSTMDADYEALYAGAYVRYDSNGQPSIITDPLNFSIDQIYQNSLDVYEIPLVLHMTIAQYADLGSSWVDEHFERINKTFGATLGTEDLYKMPDPRDVETFPAVGNLPKTPTTWMYNNTGAGNDGYLALNLTGTGATLAIDWPGAMITLNVQWTNSLIAGTSFGGYRYITGPSAIEILDTSGETIATKLVLEPNLVTLGNNSGTLDYIAIVSSTDIFESEPVVTVTGNATVRAVVDYTKGDGKLSRINIINGGSSYDPNSNPTVTIAGATDTITKAYAGLGNILQFARDFTSGVDSEQEEINTAFASLSTSQKSAIETQGYVQLRFKYGHNITVDGADVLFTDTTMIREQLSQQFNVPKGRVTDYDYNLLIGQPKIKFVRLNNTNIDLTEDGSTPKTIIVANGQWVGYNNSTYTVNQLGNNNEHQFTSENHYAIQAYLTAAHDTPVSQIPITNGVAIYDKVLVRTSGSDGPATLPQYDLDQPATGATGWEQGLDFMEIGIQGDEGYKFGRPWFKVVNTYYRSDSGMGTYGYPDVKSDPGLTPSTGGENHNTSYTASPNYDKFIRKFLHVQVYSGDYGKQGQFGGYARFPYPYHVAKFSIITSGIIINDWAMYEDEYTVLMLRFFQGLCHIKDNSIVSGIIAHEMGHVLGLYHTFSDFDIQTGDKIWDTPISELNTNFNTSKSNSFGTYLRPTNQAIREDGTRIVTIENNVMSYNSLSVFFTKEQAIQMRRVLSSHLVGYINFINYPSISVFTDSEGLVKYPVEYTQPSSKRTPFYTQNARKVELGASYLQDIEYNRLSGGSIQATHVNSDYLFTDNAQIINCRIKGSLELERGVGKFVALQTNNFATNIITITSSYTIFLGNHTIVATTGTGETITLPLSNSVREGAIFVFKNASVNLWLLACSGSDTLDNPTVVPRNIVAGESIQVQNFGKNNAWYIIGNYVPP